MLPPPPRSTLFPYTTLFRSLAEPSMSVFDAASAARNSRNTFVNRSDLRVFKNACRVDWHRFGHIGSGKHRRYRDRKSTRLNSSHLVISYAVFCLKKKKMRKH